MSDNSELNFSKILKSPEHLQQFTPLNRNLSIEQQNIDVKDSNIMSPILLRSPNPEDILLKDLKTDNGQSESDEKPPISTSLLI